MNPLKMTWRCCRRPGAHPAADCRAISAQLSSAVDLLDLESWRELRAAELEIILIDYTSRAS
jgi:hypothetical protein